MSIVNRKLLVSLPQFSRERGSAFSFVSRVTTNVLRTAVTHNRKLMGRYAPLEETLIATTLPAGPVSLAVERAR